jgi:hypothetical protein
MVNAAENDRCWACERLKPRSSLAPKVDTPVSNKTSLQIPVKDNQFVQSIYSERNKPNLLIVPKRKVGRPKKISQQENVAEQFFRSCEMIRTAASGTGTPDFAKTCTKRLQERSDSHQHHQETTKVLASDLLATVSENEIKRKRGRPKKIVSRTPEISVLNIEQSSDFKEQIREVQTNLNRSDSKQFKKLKSKNIYSKNNPRSQKSAYGKPLFPLELQNVNTDPKRGKVGRPKKFRCLDDFNELPGYSNYTNIHEESDFRMDPPSVKSKRLFFRCLDQTISKPSFQSQQSPIFDTKRSSTFNAESGIGKNQKNCSTRGKKSSKKSKDAASISKLSSKIGDRGDMI